MSKFLSVALVMSVLSVTVWAAGPLTFKNFAPGKDGVWETTTTTAVSSQPSVQKACVDVAQSKAAIERVLSNPSPIAQCTFKILADSKSAAEVEQDCSIGKVRTKLTTKMKKLSDDVYETQVQSDTMGKHTSATMVSRYKGPCTAADKASQSSSYAERCAKCKSQVEQLKARCKSAAGPERQMCRTSLQQVEAMCQMSCVPTHG